jgi:hypothetical protein
VEDAFVRTPTAPAFAPAAIAATMPADPGTKASSTTASTAIAARSRSGHNCRAMPHTAWATMATATIFNPCNAPAPSGPATCVPVSAKPSRISAEGRVKATKAASAPAHPARIMPSANPTWLEAGPGRNWHSATRSA